MAAKEREVEITLTTIGPSRPAKLRVPSSIKVHDLRRLVAADGHLPEERLKLVLRGKILLDKKNSYGDDATVGLENGDSLVVAVMPKPPPKHFHEDDYEDDDDLRFQIPQSTSWWKRRVFCFLHEKMKLPGTYNISSIERLRERDLAIVLEVGLEDVLDVGWINSVNLVLEGSIQAEGSVLAREFCVVVVEPLKVQKLVEDSAGHWWILLPALSHQARSHTVEHQKQKAGKNR